ncbi:CHAT domain-containing protein [Streptomyces sp. Go40/10]|uniref:CHAT domain-containing protein n=1 Tax=Streptomyces sp. Go40/10 TaxID=2825844 RepID=UPI001E2AF874|nr:CHAT domain-containing protein [Streptomyces sp. Go40/10]UFR01262.1 CHAT domain-containing protein [Streptomyces sp. Go40/10]
MSEAGMAPVAQRAAAALARTEGFSVPLEPEGHTGTRGPELDALVGELEDLLAELTAEPGEEATAAVVGARLGRCRAARFLLEGDPADRERALALLEEARSSALLGEEEREAAYRSLVALAGSRLVRLSRQVMTGLSGQWTVDRLMSLAALGTPLAGGGSGLVEDSALLVRLLLERDHPQMTPRLREDLRAFGEMTEAHLAGDHEGLLRGGRYAAATMADREVPPSVSTLMTLALDQIERPRGEAAAEAEETRDARAGDTVEPEEVRGVMSRFLALAEVMAPGMMGPDGLSELLAEMSGPGGAEGEERHSLPSRMVAALLHVALAFRTGDMQGFREALRLMHEASANGELDGRAQTEWLQAVVPAVLHGAALTGGSLQDEDMAQYLVEAYHWEDDPTSVNAANLRVCAESVRLLGRLTSALDRHDAEAIDDVIDALCELELDETCAGAEEWTAMLSTFVLGLAYLGRVVHGTNGSDRTTDLRAAVHHLQWVTEMSVDMPVMRSILDIACAPLITLTAIVESDPGRIAEGVRRARAALDGVAFTSEFRPRARGGIAIALDTLHQLTGDPGALDEAIDELTRARAELPDGGPGGAGLTWDLAALRAKRALLRPDPTGTAVDAVAPDAVAELRAAVGLARTSLRSSAEDVLLQQGVGRGLRIARAAADRGRTAAFWALRAGLPEEAIACLEAGRSLVLGAAAVSAGVADRLAALGESELAERWRTAAAGDDAERGEDRSLGELSAAAGTGGTPGDLRGPLELLAAAGMGAPGLPGDLRRRSLDVLRGQGGADVQPQLATVTDLRAGLRATGADALLYLVPGVDDPDGAVLVVTADGPVTALALPGLAPDGRGPVARYLAAGADRQRREAADDGTGDPGERRRHALHRWQQALDDLCAWAGEVLGPALDALRVWDRALAEAGLADAPAGAPDAVRLVIVPCGDLGVVPWQAAVLRPPVARGAPRAVRACEVAVLTYAASGREFLRAAARRRMAPADRPALVFHGADDLAWAEEEIDTLAAVHYRKAVVHRPDEDPATPGTVLDLLGGRAAAPASLVHLACHGLAGPDPTRSALRLAAPDGAGEPSATGGDLTLSTLLETPAEGDAFRAEGPLVVCGGCETDLTTRDHDEALTLTSVLVHRLAADAIGSRWKVDDMRSELLMLVLHDALDRGLAPPDALRAAQRWMLTPPDARPPVRALKDIAAPWRLAEDFRDRPDTWAAFVHHGNPAPAAASARRQEGDGA